MTQNDIETSLLVGEDIVRWEIVAATLHVRDPTKTKGDAMTEKHWIDRAGGQALAGEKLADGSWVAFDASNETVISMNATVHAAYSVLEERMTLEELRHTMSRALGTFVPEEVAAQAVVELEGVGLVTRYATEESAPAESRRAVLQAFAEASGYAIPAAVALKASEQRLLAQTSGSGPTTTSTTTSTTTPAPPELWDYNLETVTAAPTLFTAGQFKQVFEVQQGCNNPQFFDAGTHTVNVAINGPGTLNLSTSSVVIYDPTEMPGVTVTLTSVDAGGKSGTLTVTIPTGGLAFGSSLGLVLQTWTPGDLSWSRFLLSRCSGFDDVAV
jgi:hypothetical protein